MRKIAMPLENLSRKEQTPKTKAPLLDLEPTTSLIRLVPVLSTRHELVPSSAATTYMSQVRSRLQRSSEQPRLSPSPIATTLFLPILWQRKGRARLAITEKRQATSGMEAISNGMWLVAMSSSVASRSTYIRQNGTRVPNRFVYSLKPMQLSPKRQNIGILNHEHRECSSSVALPSVPTMASATDSDSSPPYSRLVSLSLWAIAACSSSGSLILQMKRMLARRPRQRAMSASRANSLAGLVKSRKMKKPTTRTVRLATKVKVFLRLLRMSLRLREQVRAGTRLMWLICSEAQPTLNRLGNTRQYRYSMSADTVSTSLTSMKVGKKATMMRTSPPMYQGMRLPRWVLVRSERQPTRGVASPSVICPARMAAEAAGVRTTSLRKSRRQLNQQVEVRSLMKWPTPQAKKSSLARSSYLQSYSLSSSSRSKVWFISTQIMQLYSRCSIPNALLEIVQSR